MNAPAAASTLTAQAFKSDVKPVWCPGCGDFSVLSAITKALPMLELRPENVAEAIAVTHPFAVDVASGVEAEPGRKDHAAMAAFFEAAKGASVTPA